MQSDSTSSKSIKRDCLHCGKSMLVFPSVMAKGKGKFCSQRCSGLMRDQKPLGERFWAKVHKTDTCWLWTGSVNRRGYGSITKGGQPTGVHRIAWELANGPIPDGLWVLHSCDNPPCVRNDGENSHLHLGNQSENMAEMTDRGRNAKAKLTHELADQIRSRYAEGGITRLQLAHEFGVSADAIGLVVRFERWNRAH